MIKTENMENCKTFKLIEGTFSAAEARTIILNFYNTKILFHNHQLLAMAEGSSGNRKETEQRIIELDKTRKSITELLTMESGDKQFDVKGYIEIGYKD
jgi:hypothetical protein